MSALSVAILSFSIIISLCMHGCRLFLWPADFICAQTNAPKLYRTVNALWQLPQTASDASCKRSYFPSISTFSALDVPRWCMFYLLTDLIHNYGRCQQWTRNDLQFAAQTQSHCCKWLPVLKSRPPSTTVQVRSPSHCLLTACRCC